MSNDLVIWSLLGIFNEQHFICWPFSCKLSHTLHSRRLACIKNDTIQVVITVCWRFHSSLSWPCHQDINTAVWITIQSTLIKTLYQPDTSLTLYHAAWHKSDIIPCSLTQVWHYTMQPDTSLTLYHAAWHKSDIIPCSLTQVLHYTMPPDTSLTLNHAARHKSYIIPCRLTQVWHYTMQPDTSLTLYHAA